MSDSTFAITVRTAREAAGLSRKELALRAGLSYPAICHFENGVRLDPHASTIRRLALGLGLDPAALVN